MSKSLDKSDIEMTAERAIQVVLNAESKAKQSIKKCEMEVEKHLQDARHKAQRIDERVDARITRIHQRCSRVVTDQVSALGKLQEEQAKYGQSTVVNEESVLKVVEKFADMLTGIKEEVDTIPE